MTALSRAQNQNEETGAAAHFCQQYVIILWHFETL